MEQKLDILSAPLLYTHNTANFSSSRMVDHQDPLQLFLLNYVTGTVLFSKTFEKYCKGEIKYHSHRI